MGISCKNQAKIKIAAMSALWGAVGGEAFVPWIKEVKKAGYDGIAGFSGDFEPFYDEPGELKNLLADNDLGLSSIDIWGINLNFDQYRRVCGFMNEMGCENLVMLGGYGKQDGDFKALACVLDYIGEIAKASGINMVYHNHSGLTGETFADMDKLLAYADPSKMSVMVDTGHATCDFNDIPEVGERAVRFLRKYWDRVSFIEFKDFNDKTGLATPVGEGFCDHGAVFALLKEKGYCGWITVEQNGPSLGRTPFDCAKTSIEFIRKGLNI
ncbi:MAG: sugar phosphate isomerase/epimerase [Oscillospiraceae bacterium]|nr:sugar phosphate isomerase/epimerase [Oscillospiraceae bacterium]